MYAAYKKGTYPTFWQSLTFTVDVLLTQQDVYVDRQRLPKFGTFWVPFWYTKVNKPMWAWQLCNVTSVNK